MMESKDKIPTRDCGTWKPPVKVHFVGGRRVQERLPAVPYAKTVDMTGTVRTVPLHNGGANRGKLDPYKLVTEAELRAEGDVWYDRCPQGMEPAERARLLPEKLHKARVCTAAANGGPIGLDAACVCIEELIAFRREIHEIRERETAVNQQTLMDKHAKLAEAQVEALKMQNASMLQQQAQTQQILEHLKTQNAYLLSRMGEGAAAVPVLPETAPALAATETPAVEAEPDEGGEGESW